MKSAEEKARLEYKSILISQPASKMVESNFDDIQNNSKKRKRESKDGIFYM